MNLNDAPANHGSYTYSMRQAISSEHRLDLYHTLYIETQPWVTHTPCNVWTGTSFSLFFWIFPHFPQISQQERPVPGHLNQFCLFFSISSFYVYWLFKQINVLPVEGNYSFKVQGKIALVKFLSLHAQSAVMAGFQERNNRFSFDPRCMELSPLGACEG